jgi:hypothetical protein
MNIVHDKISICCYKKTKPILLYQCLLCRYNTQFSTMFVTHKCSKKCSKGDNNWFKIMKKKGYTTYHRIVHAFYWREVMKCIESNYQKSDINILLI